MGEAKRRRLAGYKPPVQQVPLRMARGYEPVDLNALDNRPTVQAALRHKGRQMTALHAAALLALVGINW